MRQRLERLREVVVFLAVDEIFAAVFFAAELVVDFFAAVVLLPADFEAVDLAGADFLAAVLVGAALAGAAFFAAVLVGAAFFVGELFFTAADFDAADFAVDVLAAAVFAGAALLAKPAERVDLEGVFRGGVSAAVLALAVVAAVPVRRAAEPLPDAIPAVAPVPASAAISEPLSSFAPTTVTSLSSPKTRDGRGRAVAGSVVGAAVSAAGETSRRWRTPSSRKMNDSTLTPMEA